MAKLKPELTYNRKEIPLEDYSKDHDGVMKRADDNFKHLMSLDEKAKKTYATILGRSFHVGVADGTVYYQVVEVTGTQVRVNLCDGICLDRYQDSVLGTGGWVQRRNIENIIFGHDALEKIFRKAQ